MNNSKIAGKMKEQIGIFSGILSQGCPKVSRRLVREVVLGIQARQSVRLTEISRFLNEPIALNKTRNRICRQLNWKGLGETVKENLLREGAGRIKENSLLILDTSDLSKKYAEKM